jgi:hypothetical protein
MSVDSSISSLLCSTVNVLACLLARLVAELLKLSLGLRSLPPELHDRRGDVVQRLFVERFPDDRLGRLRRIRAKWELQSRKPSRACAEYQRVGRRLRSTGAHLVSEYSDMGYSEYSHIGTPSIHTRVLRHNSSSMPLEAHSEQRVKHAARTHATATRAIPHATRTTHRARTGSGSPKWTSPMRVLRVPPWEHPQYPPA